MIFRFTLALILFLNSLLIPADCSCLWAKDKSQTANEVIQVNRYMDSNYGRFISRDPHGIWGDPVNIGNPYTYCGNNPINMSDPSGNSATVIGAISGFFAGVVGETVGQFAEGRFDLGQIAWSGASGAVVGGAIGFAIDTFGAGTPLTMTAIGSAKGAVALSAGVFGSATVGYGLGTAGVNTYSGFRDEGFGSRQAWGSIGRVAGSFLGGYGGYKGTQHVKGKYFSPILEVSRAEIPSIAENIQSAQEAGHPSVLTRLTGKEAIRAQRAAALGDIDAAGKGLSLDEYPFASTREGGAGSQVRPVPLLENSRQGGQLSQFYKKHKIREGSKFRVRVVDERRAE